METPILFPMSPEEYWQKLSEVMDRLLSEKLKQGDRPGIPNYLLQDATLPGNPARHTCFQDEAAGPKEGTC